MSSKPLKNNRLEQTILDNYPVLRVSSRSKDHVLTVYIPRNHHPDFYIEATGIYVEVKGYVHQKSQWMWDYWKNMPSNMKSKYKLVLQKPDLPSPLANMSYGDWFTAYGFEWERWPNMNPSWFKKKDTDNEDN